MEQLYILKVSDEVSEDQQRRREAVKSELFEFDSELPPGCKFLGKSTGTHVRASIKNIAGFAHEFPTPEPAHVVPLPVVPPPTPAPQPA